MAQQTSAADGSVAQQAQQQTVGPRLCSVSQHVATAVRRSRRSSYQRSPRQHAPCFAGVWQGPCSRSQTLQSALPVSCAAHVAAAAAVVLPGTLAMPGRQGRLSVHQILGCCGCRMPEPAKDIRWRPSSRCDDRWQGRCCDWRARRTGVTCTPDADTAPAVCRHRSVRWRPSPRARWATRRTRATSPLAGRSPWRPRRVGPAVCAGPAGVACLPAQAASVQLHGGGKLSSRQAFWRPGRAGRAGAAC